jgi:sortase (surface protein transpeptidase)
MRKKREMKNQNLSNSVDNKEQWEKMLSNNKNQRNLYDNIFDVQVQAEKLQKEAEFKTKLYKLDPVKNSDKREEITNLYIDSIQAKLQILKKINERSEDEED